MMEKFPRGDAAYYILELPQILPVAERGIELSSQSPLTDLGHYHMHAMRVESDVPSERQCV